MRPSDVLNGKIEDLQFDILIATIGIEEELKAAKKSATKAKGRYG